ncbi:MAG: OsmC family peroxiredoxin [Bryobacteraceae bacterium]
MPLLPPRVYVPTYTIDSFGAALAIAVAAGRVSKKFLLVNMRLRRVILTNMKRTATAQWSGNLKEGSGTISTESQTLAKTPYSFSARFEQGKGTNPEELLAAAHAGCFTMALSLQLQEAGITAESLETKCTVTLDPKALTISSRN